MAKTIYQLAASVICADMGQLKEEIKKLESGGIDALHFDVMDGQFVSRLGLHPEMLLAVRRLTSLPVDVHLMINSPEQFIAAFAQAGATRITVHAEATPHLHRAIKAIKDQGLEAGVGLNPATPLAALDYVLDDINSVMLMAINPGIVGHKLIPQTYAKIADLKRKLAGRAINIAIDGGVTPGSAPQMIAAGATELVCGTGAIFQPPAGLDAKIKALRSTIDGALKGGQK